MPTRKEYIDALKREREFVQTTGDKRRLADVDAELAKYGEKPTRRGRPETASADAPADGDDAGPVDETVDDAGDGTAPAGE